MNVSAPRIIRDAMHEVETPFVLSLKFDTEENVDRFLQQIDGYSLFVRCMQGCALVVMVACRTDKNKLKGLEAQWSGIDGLQKASTRGPKESMYLLVRLNGESGCFEAISLSSVGLDWPGFLMSALLEPEKAALVFARWQFKDEPKTLEGLIRYCRRGNDKWEVAKGVFFSIKN